MTDPTDTHYSAVILYYRLGPQIADCLDSLYGQSLPPTEVVLVDNASGDGIVEQMAGRWPCLRVLSLTQNGGYAAGMNAGVRALQRPTDYVLILTHEVVMIESCAEELLSALGTSSAAQAGPLLKRRSTGSIWSTGGVLTRFGRPMHQVALPDRVQHVTWVDGACLMLNREAFDAVGGFDLRFFLYWEDVDLAVRLAGRGGSVIVPSAIATQDTNTVPTYSQARNRILMWRIHRRTSLVAIAFVSQMLRALADMLFRRKPQSSLDRLRGIRDGLLAVTTSRRGAPEQDPHRIPLAINLINPIPTALAHFEREMISLLTLDGARATRQISSVSIEGIRGIIQRVRTMVSLVVERSALAKVSDAETFIVLWPALGYFDALTWVRLSRRNRVMLIVHDPIPLRRQSGYSRLGKWIFRRMTHLSGLEVICLSESASKALLSQTGVSGRVLPHPIVVDPSAITIVDETPVIRVLGQFKSARDLSVLKELGSSDIANTAVLEIVGRGWPSVAGWKVDDRFVSEGEFDELIEGASCVLIPYTHFFQSGVAVRCLEKRTPIVGPRHEHLETLYGEHWPGLATDASSWSACIAHALRCPPQALEERLENYAAQTRTAWHSALKRDWQNRWNT
jgi:GT2 family glycosyltransferase